jgi:hypothetical protein
MNSEFENEKSFGISDIGMLFDILRSKMYSDPIAAICRELSANARDANYEAGKADVPIEITTPNSSNPSFKIKDCGPGISPDRMENVFINYGSSTKNKDSNYAGSFGLGAKVPFAYSDIFWITTVYNGTLYKYMSYIDESKIGKMSLLSSEKTELPNSTEIEIPIKPEHHATFYEQAIEVGKFWKVKPNIDKVQHTSLFVDSNVIVEGDGWKLYVGSESSYHSNKDIRVLVNNVEYSFDRSQISSVISNLYNFIKRNTLVLSFSSNEVSVSSNREKLFLDEKTKKALRDKVSEIDACIYKTFNDTVNTKASLFEANYFVVKSIHDSYDDDLKGIYWNDRKLYLRYLKVSSVPNHGFIISNVSSYGRNRSIFTRIVDSISMNYILSEKTVICLNNIDRKEFDNYSIKKIIKSANAETVLIFSQSLLDQVKDYLHPKIKINNLSDFMKFV